MAEESNQPVLHAQLGDILELHEQLQGLRQQIEELKQQNEKISVALLEFSGLFTRQTAVMEKLAGVRR